jgi:hypothetical protein
MVGCGPPVFRPEEVITWHLSWSFHSHIGRVPLQLHPAGSACRGATPDLEVRKGHENRLNN